MSYGQIILNGVNYSGTHVEPNPNIPTGATVTPLTNVKFDEDYFSIPSGGGGGGGSTITTETVTITTNSYGWGEIVDGNGVLLDPSTHKLLSATVVVDNTVQVEQYLQCAFFRSQNNNAFSDNDLYAFTIQNLNDGGFIRNQGTYTIEISYI